MSRERKSNREAKKEPALSMKEKRAAKKAKNQAKSLLGGDGAARRPIVVPPAKRS